MTDSNKDVGFWKCETPPDVPAVRGPLTDEEAATLVGSGTVGQLAIWGVYLTYRKRGESVEESYQHIMNDLREILESKNRPGLSPIIVEPHSDGCRR